MISKNYSTIFLIFATVFMISLTSCDLQRKYEKQEEEEIQDYLSRNSDLNFVLKPSGLYYLEVEAGTGLSPLDNDSVFVIYTGKFLGGEIFDSNTGETDTYNYVVGNNTNIAGFNEGISYMLEGGKSLVLIPSSLAWGPNGIVPFIEGYTPVLFYLELVRVKRPGK
jgi:FKBP-type peptidyl-prolyl cis-trans isomerase